VKAKQSAARSGVLTLGAPVALFAGEVDETTTVFEREIALTGEYKTRKFALDRKHFDQVIANHKASGVDPAVDLGHESLSDSSKPAVGWVRELSIRPSAVQPNRDALVAKFELNDLGMHEVKNQHFRYLSVGMDLHAKNKQTGEDIGAELDHLALVKRPFIENMQPLSLSAHAPVQEIKMKLALKALGLDSEADESEALAAVSSLKDFERNVVALTGKASKSEALGALTAIVEKAATADRATAELAALKSAQAKAEIAALIDEATDPARGGKVAPAKREEVIALADKIGIDGLRSYLSMLPKKVASASESPRETNDAGPAAGELALSANEMSVARQLVGDDPIALKIHCDKLREYKTRPDKLRRSAVAG
jgi:phage I-like protein